MKPLSDPFPGDWYADADRPSSPAAWKIGREVAIDAVRIRSPREVHPTAIAFLRAYDRLGYLDELGGADGVVDASEAAYFLTWAFACIEAIFRLGKGQR